MISGRIISGFGLAIVSTSVPLYQRSTPFLLLLQATDNSSEISPAKHRGRYVVINHVGLVVGLASAFWYGH